MKIGIAGAGILGRLLALQAIELGWQINIFDQENETTNQNCSYAAAGMISPYSEIKSVEPIILQWGLRSLELWPHILKQLPEPVYYKQTGSLVVAHPQDQNELQDFKNFFHYKLKQSPLEINPREKEPGLNPSFKTGLYLSEEAHIDNIHLLTVLKNYLLSNHVKWHSNFKVQILKSHKIIGEASEHDFDWVFDCRGLGAKDVFKDLRGVRGELIHLQSKEISFTHSIRLLHPRYTIYLVPKPNNTYAIGASSIESEDYSPISVQTTLELLSAAYSLHRGFAEARILSTHVHCRPTLPNHLPIIETNPGITRINGLYRHGYLLSPALVEQAISGVNEITGSNIENIVQQNREQRIKQHSGFE
ncbi:MAG: FAD-dependent oxidoreductase [Proteobacteria bacterium]|nr:FAD-dependent oxidoreductase [Pseudomonadota bacterium]